MSKPEPVKPLAAKPVEVKASPPPSTAEATPRRAMPAPASVPAAAVPAPPAADGVAAKPPRPRSAGLSTRDLEHFADLLLEKRREIVGDMSSMEREALRSAGGGNQSSVPLQTADMGTDSYEQEFTLGLVEKDRHLLREINHALAKIHAGTYGICEGTGDPIGKPRLEAQPWARHSIEYARQREKMGMGIRIPTMVR